MYLKYYYETPKHQGYNFNPSKGFKHIIELSDADDCFRKECKDACVGECYDHVDMDREVYKAFRYVENQFGSIDYDGVELLVDREGNMIRLYFKNEEDAMYAKMTGMEG